MARRRQPEKMYVVLDASGREVGGSEEVRGLAAFADSVGGVVISEPSGEVVYASPRDAGPAMGPSPDNPQEEKDDAS